MSNYSAENTHGDFNEKLPHFRERIARDIRLFGWHIIGVLPDKDQIPFMYTVGNYEVGLPELLIIGSLDAGDVLNAVCARMRDQNRQSGEGELIDVGGKFPFMAVNADDDLVKDQYTCQVAAHYSTEDYKSAAASCLRPLRLVPR
jgi:Domain of unknown function (DUF4262)